VEGQEIDGQRGERGPLNSGGRGPFVCRFQAGAGGFVGPAEHPPWQAGPSRAGRHGRRLA